jgi:hypothetical protein
MQRINTAFFYRLAMKLVPLASLQTGAQLYLTSSFSVINTARNDLNIFLTNTLIPPITCYGNGEALHNLLAAIADEPYKPDRPLEWFEVNAITEALKNFEISLQSDFGLRDTFIVSPKGAYSTTSLAERGETVVSETAHALVPSMKKDLHDACRCIAFELPTAAAFHLFRALEAMVREYGEYVRGKPWTKIEKKNGLGGYANFLKERNLGVDARIINSIEQITKLHRNPTMHPEWHLSTTEILPTLGMTVSAIETIALDWERRKNTPNVPLSDILPDDSKVQSLLEDGDEGKPHGELQPGDAPSSVDIESGNAKTAGKRKAKTKGRKEAGA